MLETGPDDAHPPIGMGDAARVFSAVLSDDEGDDVAQPQDFPVIPGYVIDRELGSGASGTVYRGVRSGSDRPVAIKLLRHTIGASRDAQRAWREIDVLESLRLPAVPRLLDHGVVDDRLYLVTEWIDGQPLPEYAAGKDLDIRAQAALLADVADAVQSLHEVGVIHRDLKPSNILVDGQGRPVVIDLGLAALLADDVTSTLTEEGQPIGSPAFMSPEQARGEKARVNTRSDVYSLGATAYVLLTGETPHDMHASLFEAVRRVSQDQPRAPRDLQPTLPRTLEAVLVKAVAPEAERRYASAGEFAKDLRRWLAGESVEAVAPGRWQRMVKIIGRHPIKVTAAVCFTFFVMTVVTSWLIAQWLIHSPAGILHDNLNYQFVVLNSRSGGPLYRWDGGVKDSIPSAAFIRDYPDPAVDSVVVLAFTAEATLKHKGQLCVFDADDPDTLVWRSGTGPESFEMPAPISDVEGAYFHCADFQLQDVFPEHAGDEIVAMHRHMPHSATCIRVYSLTGEVLYECWHDGHLVDMYWMSGPGLLLCCGVESEGAWTQFVSKDDALETRTPKVVFAVKPTFDTRADHWIHAPGGKGTVQPQWYKYVWPLDISDVFMGSRHMYQLEAARPLHDDRRFVRLQLSPIVEPLARVSLVLDEHGNCVGRVATDWYRQLIQMDDPPVPHPDAIDVWNPETDPE